jgi:A/G-specific adenine glycosylase
MPAALKSGARLPVTGSDQAQGAPCLQDTAAAPRLPVGLAGRVVAWQRAHGRHGLPWQGTREPYRVWLSEIMLQQTQVATVLGYYGRFLERFPDVCALAAAPLDEVLALWSGLGYYSRARNLHRCAQQVVAQHGGEFPRASAALVALPGIGASTAAAIAAFCFGERAAILDGNVKRVLARALGFAGDLAESAQERALWELARALLPEEGIEAYTQGLMDLGAGVCTLRRPACERCPLASDCAARQADRPEDFPVRSRRLRRGRRENVLLWLTHGGTVWLQQRPTRGVWAGLWSLPEWPDEASLRASTATWPGAGTALPTIEHALTHFDWTLRPLRWELPADLPAAELAALESKLPLAGRWCSQDEALRVALPAPIRRLLAGSAPGRAPVRPSG